MAKYTVDDILDEYSPDGKKSGIQKDKDTSFSHDTFETEKLLHALTSDKPLSQSTEEKAGYHTRQTTPRSSTYTRTSQPVSHVKEAPVNAPTAQYQRTSQPVSHVKEAPANAPTAQYQRTSQPVSHVKEAPANAPTAQYQRTSQPVSHVQDVAPEDTVIDLPMDTLPEENLVDIKSTIANIKIQKAKQAQRNEGVAAVSREKFPTQQLRRDHVSYVKSGRQNTPTPSYDGVGYDGVVKVEEMPISEEEKSAEEAMPKPTIRQMSDSTRAKDKKNHKKSVADRSYDKDTITGEFQRSSGYKPEPAVKTRKPDAVYVPPETPKQEPLRNMRQRVHRQADTAQREPDDLDAIWKELCNLRNVIFFRCIALLVLFLFGVVFAVLEMVNDGAMVEQLTPRGFAFLELLLGLIALVVAFPTVKNGLWHMLKLHADGDSMAALPFTVSLITAILVVIAPDVLADEMVHLYIPVGLMALFCNAIGRLLVVRRAMRNCKTLTKQEQKRVLSYVSQEEVAELLTHGLARDVPIVATVRRADGICDFLRYTYSLDMGDNLCRTMVPVVGIVSLALSIFFTFVRVGTDFGFLWFSAFLSIWDLLLCAGCCVGCALISNMPLEWESKRAVQQGSTLLGYQSVDDFYDMNTLMVSAQELFPEGSVQIAGMKVFSGATVDEVLLDAASLVHCFQSVLNSGFQDMISDHESLLHVDDYVCEDNLGFCGWISNRRILLGGREMMHAHNVEGLPSKNRESELVEAGDEVLYLSISGCVSAMFSVRFQADETVARQMRNLRQENIALVIQSVDYMITPKLLHRLFGFPENILRVLPSSMEHLYREETAKAPCISASVTVGKGRLAAAPLLFGARRVRRASSTGTIVQIVSALLGLSLALIHMATGAYETMTAGFFLIYHTIFTLLTALMIRLR